MKECPICGSPIGRNKMCCSMKCYAEYKSNKKVCVVCGKEFYCPKCNDVKTCGADCSKIHRQNRYKAGIYDQSLARAHEMAKASPLTGKFETNNHAKHWIIEDPSGQRYEIQNLMLWCENNAQLLPSPVITFYRGIQGIKRTYEGKKIRGSYQYKGWHLISWCDTKPQL